MKRLLLTTLSFVLLGQSIAYAAHQSPLPSLAPTPIVDQTVLLSEAQAGLSDWDIIAYSAHPAELRTATAQHFIDEAFARFQDLSPSMSVNEIHDVRAALRAEDPTQDPGLPEKMRAFTDHLTNTKTGDRLGAWSLGLLSGEIEDNATNAKSPDLSDREIRSIIPLNTLDALFPAMHDLRFSLLTVRLFNLKAQDWQRLTIASHTMRQIISAAPTKDQTTIAGLFAMNIPSDTTRLIDKGSAHIEFVNADGSVKNMATYTDARGSTAEKSIHCGIDASPIGPGLFFLPLSVSAIGKDIAESSFQGLVNACEKIDGLQPAMNEQTGLVTSFSTMLGLLVMADPADGKVIMQHVEHADTLHATAQQFLFRHLH